MRIGDVARLSGISARSIRHYHRIGILDEPPRTAGGYRAYQIGDLVRLMHIRHLAESGVPLRAAPDFLDSGSTGSVREEIDDLTGEIRARIEGMQRQLARLAALAERLDSGLPVGLLPPEVTRALDRCGQEAEARPGVREMVRRESDLLSLVALTTPLPPHIAAAYAALGHDTALRAAYLDLLERFHRIEGRHPGHVAEEIDALVDALVDNETLRRISLPEGLDGAAVEAADPALKDLVPDPAQREVVRRVITALGRNH